jgi:hypothetical protein
MSVDDSIDTLIKELKELRVQETNLINRIEQANRRRQGGGTSSSDEHANRGRLTALREGDRVYIKNNIRRPVFPQNNWTVYDERRATVTRVNEDKIFIKTDNGNNTWRARKNLSVLTSSSDSARRGTPSSDSS